MRKIIFLDIDGVLNGWNNVIKITWGILRIFHLHRRFDICGIYFTKMILLKIIILRTGADVILCSSWRRGWNKPYKKYTR